MSVFLLLMGSIIGNISALNLQKSTDQADLPIWNIGNYWKYDMEFVYEDASVKLDCDNFILTAKVVEIENEEYILELEETDVSGNIEWKGVVDLGQFYATISGFAHFDTTTLGITAVTFHVEGEIKVLGVRFTTFEFYQNMEFNSNFDFLDFPISMDESTWSANTNYNIIVDVYTGLGIEYHDTLSGNFLDEITLKRKETANGYESYRISGSEGSVSDLWYSAEAGYLVKVREAVDWGDLIGTFNLDLMKTNFNEGNHPPETPEKPSGTDNGDIDQEYSFSSVTTDQDNDQIFYLFNWGDKTDSGWLGPYDSGIECTASHNWSGQGIYHVSVKAKDTENLESTLSESLLVIIGDGGSPVVTFTMHRIKEIGSIEGIGHSEADWSYRVSCYDDGWSDSYKEYCTNDDDHEGEVDHIFDVTVKKPMITIKVWDRDPYIPFVDDHDLADVSSKDGGGEDNNIDDKRGAIAYFYYDIVENEVINIDKIENEGEYYTTSGTFAPDNGDNSNLENDAKVWFKITNNYIPPQAQISYNGVQSTKHPINFYASISGGMSPYKYHWNFGDGTTSSEKNPIHVYTSPGEYEITLTVTDKFENNGVDTVENFKVVENIPPEKPVKPRGPNEIQKGVLYYYSSSSEDSEEDEIYYMFDWGDGTYSEWIGPYESGEECEASHSWSTKGDYQIKVISKDEFGAESEWSKPLSISMPRNKLSNNLLLNVIEKIIHSYPILERILIHLINYK